MGGPEVPAPSGDGVHLQQDPPARAANLKRMRRRIVAVGDLHGDVERLVRILQQQKVFLPGTQTWDPAQTNVDVILLGDYVDWRGEPLEGARGEWDRGVERLLRLILTIDAQVEALSRDNPEFRSTFHPLLGNHERLMLDTWGLLSRLESRPLAALAGRYDDTGQWKKLLDGLRKEPGAAATATWITQGGLATVRSFGGLDPWMNVMRRGLAEVLEQRLQLGVVVNGWLFSHSLPDSPEYWLPLETVHRLPAGQRRQVEDAFIWGRRLWGYDAGSRKVPPMTQHEVDTLLERVGVRGAVVGHSLAKQVMPLEAFGGRVVNIDLHGRPGSQPYTTFYETEG